MEHVPVCMVREHLNEIPQYPLPAGFAARWYAPGDESAWVRIHEEAEEYVSVTPALFEEQFHADLPALRERQCFLCDRRGRPVATATAWYDDRDQCPDWARLARATLLSRPGRVHWVAVVPRCQGRGLAKSLLTLVCGRLKELGHERAYLTTQTARLPAIHLYLKFGFRPDIRPVLLNDAEQAAWRDVGERLPAEDRIRLGPAGR